MSSVPVTLGILAGGGRLPSLLADAALAAGKRVCVIVFEGQPQPDVLPEGVADMAVFPLGAVGAVLAQLKVWGVSEVVLAGNLSKPSFFNLKPDMKGLQLMMKARHYHDDQLLRAVTDVLAEEGFVVRSVADLAPKLLADVGFVGEARWEADDEADIALGLRVLDAMGGLDIGQAVVVYRQVVLGVEAVEGTDTLIARCAPLRGGLEPGAKGGILVKKAKAGQTDMADLPAVGPATLEVLGKFSYRGLVVGGGRTVLLGAGELARLADARGLVFEVRES